MIGMLTCLMAFFTSHANGDSGELQSMRNVLTKANRCGTSRHANDEEIAGAVFCYNSVLSPDLTARDKSKLILFLGSIASAPKVTSCDISKYHLESFPAATKHFLCVSFMSSIENREVNRVIFFKRDPKKLSIYSIYEPVSWK